MSITVGNILSPSHHVSLVHQNMGRGILFNERRSKKACEGEKSYLATNVSVDLNHYTLFDITNTFISNFTRLKLAKIKQKLSNSLSLNFCYFGKYLHSLSMLSSKK